MTQQEKQINYMGPFITMVFLFFIVGFLTTANTQFQGPLKETFDYFLLVPCLSGLWRGRLVVD